MGELSFSPEDALVMLALYISSRSALEVHTAYVTLCTQVALPATAVCSSTLHNYDDHTIASSMIPAHMVAQMKYMCTSGRATNCLFHDSSSSAWQDGCQV